MTISQSIKHLAAMDDEVYSIIGEVKDIDQVERTCTVSPINGDADIYGVRLQSVISEGEGFVVFPKKGSQIVVTFLNKQTGYVALCAEVEQIEIKIDGQIFQYSSDGLHIASNVSDLKSELNAICTLFDGLLTTLQSFQVMTSVGPSANVMPNTIADLISKQVEIAQIKSKINTFLT